MYREVWLPAACRFDTDEVHITKSGDRLLLRPCGKDWGRYFAAKSRGSMPKREAYSRGVSVVVQLFL